MATIFVSWGQVNDLGYSVGKVEMPSVRAALSRAAQMALDCKGGQVAHPEAIEVYDFPVCHTWFWNCKLMQFSHVSEDYTH